LSEVRSQPEARRAQALTCLVVHGNRDLAAIWAGFLEREGIDCRLAASVAEAIEAMRALPFDALLIDVELGEGDGLAAADFAAYRYPDMPVIAVTPRGFFSDGAIFELVPNARGLLRAPMRLEDMAALVSHYGGRYAAAARTAEP
jgi:DNA-binding NtrC family response regulator